MALTTRALSGTLFPSTAPRAAQDDASQETVARLVFPGLASSTPRPEVEALFQSLSTTEQASLREHWGAENLESLFALAKESEESLFCQGLLHWARAQERAGRRDLAVQTYTALENNPELAPTYRRRAGEYLAAAQGRGNFGDRVEHFIRDTADQALSPPALLSMVGAGLAFRGSRLLFLRAFSQAGLSQAPLRLTAAGAAFNVEALSFPLLHRVAHQGFGHPADWNRGALGRDILSSYLFLGGMRATGYGTTRFLQGGSRLAAPLGALTPWQSFTRSAAMYGGIVGGTYLETLAGLKSFEDPSDLFSHSLATFLQFQLAGRVIHETLGSRLRPLERRMDQMAYGLSESPAGNRLAPVRLGTLAMAGPESSPNPFGPVLMSMMNGSPSLPMARPVVARGPETSAEAPAPVRENRLSPVESDPLHRHAIASSMVRHRGNLDAAARELNMSFEALERRLSRENNFSELSVFQTRTSGRMLFYRPALARAHSIFHQRIYEESSLNELGLSPPVRDLVRRMGISSVWDLLLTNRSEFFRERQTTESKATVSAYLREIEQNFDRRISAEEGKTFRNHPLEEGVVKSLMAENFRDYPIAHLGLEPRIEGILTQGGRSRVGELLEMPIPHWIPREAVPEGAFSGSREAMTDSVIRSLFAMLHGSPPRRYRPPQPEAPSAGLESPAATRPETPPALPGVTETELLRRLVDLRGNMAHVAESFSLPPSQIGNFIQRHSVNSELNIFQAYGKGTMLFYTPALRQAMAEYGNSAHRPESLAELGLSQAQTASLRSLGVESLRDIFLLTRFDIERNLGTEASGRLIESLNPLLQQSLNRSGLNREHLLFRPGEIKESIAHAYGNEALEALRAPEATLSLLRARGISNLGDLMNRPIPDWIRMEQLPPGSHPSAKSEHQDALIRGTYALLMERYRFPYPVER